jgi:hypothetical protein
VTQKARPASDVSNDGWTPTPVYAQINEATPDDSTFVTAPTYEGPFEVQLAPLAAPYAGASAFTPTLTIRLAGPGIVMVELLQDETLIAVGLFDPAPGFAAYTLTLSPDDAARIVYPPNGNDPDLRVRVTPLDSGSGSGSGSCVACLERLAVTRDSSGCITGVYYSDDEGALHELLACVDGTFPPDSACVACLERLCVMQGSGGCINGIFFTDDFGDLIEVLTLGSGSGSDVTPNCTNVPPETLSDTLNMDANATGCHVTLIRNSLLLEWSSPGGCAGGGATLACVDGIYTLTIGTTVPGCQSPNPKTYTAVSGTLSPFSLVYVVPACAVSASGTDQTPVTVVVSEP